MFERLITLIGEDNVNKLKKANNIANANLIYVGQVLKIK